MNEFEPDNELGKKDTVLKEVDLIPNLKSIVQLGWDGYIWLELFCQSRFGTMGVTVRITYV